MIIHKIIPIVFDHKSNHVSFMFGAKFKLNFICKIDSASSLITQNVDVIKNDIDMYWILFIFKFDAINDW